MMLDICKVADGEDKPVRMAKMGDTLITVWPCVVSPAWFFTVEWLDAAGEVKFAHDDLNKYDDPDHALGAGVVYASGARRAFHVMRWVSVQSHADGASDAAIAAYSKSGLERLFVTRSEAEAWWGAPLDI